MQTVRIEPNEAEVSFSPLHVFRQYVDIRGKEGRERDATAAGAPRAGRQVGVVDTNPYR